MKKYFTKITPEFKKLFDKKVKTSKSIVVTAHYSPDDDSISSLLSTYHYLTRELKIEESRIKIIYTGSKLGRWDYFKYYDRVNFVEDVADHLEDTDTLVLLDCSGLNRISYKNSIYNFNGYTICIDHHGTVEERFDLHLVVEGQSSIAEMVYEIFLKNVNLGKRECEIVLLGILGDTGGLKFINHKIVSALDATSYLVRKGKIDLQIFASQYQKIDERSFRLISEFMKNTILIKVGDWPKLQYSYIEKELISKNKYSDSEVSTAYRVYVDTYMRMIEGADWGFVATPKNSVDGIGFSFRSLPGCVNVRKLVQDFKIGGGHNRASGGSINAKTVDEAVKKLFEWMQKHKPILG